MERGMRIKSDPTKQGWEDSEFPILCEVCLGDNPYVRMTREQFGGACKVCERPFTIFRWKPGAKARFKSTVICQMCAKLKNACQTCILDLQYGLPIEVRDSVLAKAATDAGGTAAVTALAAVGSAMPKSDVNRQYAFNMADAAMAEGGVVPYSAAAGMLPAVHEQLLRMGRARQTYARNLPKLCSFFARGECNRGDECPYRHEMPREKDDPLSKQNYKDRYFGTEDPVAAKILGRMAGRSDAKAPEPPADTGITTLWLGGVTDSMGESELRGALFRFGDIRNVHVMPAKQCAFVEFHHRAHAEAAMAALYGNLTVSGVPLRMAWAKPKAAPADGGGAGRGDRLLGDAGSSSIAADGSSAAAAAVPALPAAAGGVAPWAAAMAPAAPSASSAAAGDALPAHAGQAAGVGSVAAGGAAGPSAGSAGPSAYPFPYPPQGYPFPYPYPYPAPGMPPGAMPMPMPPIVSGGPGGGGRGGGPVRPRGEGADNRRAAAQPFAYPSTDPNRLGGAPRR